MRPVIRKLLAHWFSIALISIGIFTGCSTTPPPPVNVLPVPGDWAPGIDMTEAECQPISGVFDNLGVREAENGVRTTDGLLSRDVLVRSLPGRQIPESVAIYSDTDVNVLDAELQGLVNRKIALEVSCNSGWHVFSFERAGNYLGNNIQEIYFRQRTWLREDRQGRLVVRALQDAEYEIRFSERTSDSSENWFRFEPASTD